MIAEIGQALLWLAAACAALQAAGPLPRARIAGLTVTAAMLHGWLWLWIAACLAWLFWTTDLSVAGVAATTAATTPAPLKLAAIVVQDGGWVVAAAALTAWAGAGLAFARPGARRSLAAGGALGLGLAAVLLLGVGPFERLTPAPTEGAGFPAAVRARLAGLGAAPPGTPLALGASRGDTTLVAVTPVAGPDSTGVVAAVRVGGTTLAPEWRETIRPYAAYAVAARALAPAGWLTVTLVPAADGQWRVGVARVGWPWLLLLAAVPVAAAVAVARRRR